MRKRSLCFLTSLVLFVALAPILSVHADYPSPAPSFTLTDIDGHSFSLSDFKGKPVALTFIAARSVICKMQVMILANASKRLGGNATFIVIGVSKGTIAIGDDTDAQLRDFKNDTGFKGIVARDTSSVSKDYGATFIPMTFLIDTLGNIWYRHVGVVNSAENIIVSELNLIPEYPTTTITLIIMVTSTIIVVGVARHDFLGKQRPRKSN
jgi:peroxiredoxin